jgi:phosphoserine phosphatase RsbU/P
MENVLLHVYFWNYVLAIIASATGVAVLALSYFRRERGDISLVTFGAYTLLYGIRLLADTRLNQYTTGTPPEILFSLTALITYIIPIPILGFLIALFGRGWKNSILWAFRGAIVFAVAGIFSDSIQAASATLMPLNNGLSILWACIIFINGFAGYGKSIPEIRIMTIGFMVFGLFVVNQNLVQLNLLPWTWKWEELGYAIFLGSLGYVTAMRFFRNEAKLLSIGREMEIARQIQSSILPRTLPTVHGLQLTARYIPMTSVAGDFYDALVQNEKRICILIADVSGHGVGAALIASMLKIAFASQRQVLSDPAQVLAGINRALADKLESNFVTAVCIFIDTDAGTIRYAGAGHPPIILHRRTERTLSELSDEGMILGPFPEAEYTSTTVNLKSGDRLILYTDGIIETQNAYGAFYGDTSFKAFIETHGDLSPENFADSLLRDLTRWSGKPLNESFDDDVTLIVVDKS